MKITINQKQVINWSNSLFTIDEFFLNDKKLLELVSELKGDDRYNLSVFPEGTKGDIRNEYEKITSTYSYSSIEEFKKAGWYDQLENEVVGIIEDLESGELFLEEDFQKPLSFKRKLNF